MDMDNPTPAFEDQRKLIEEAVKRGEKIAAQRKLELEKDYPVEDDELEIPEEVEDPGEHPLQQMSVLARIGKANKTFDYVGHKIQIRTLNQGEELEILSRLDAFPASAQARAYNVFAAALCLEMVDGKPYFNRRPLGPHEDVISFKFREIQDFYPETIMAIANELYALRDETRQKAQYAKKG